jgi:membrane protease YdiL (CAAX protease family)
MKTPIGRALLESKPKLALAALTGAVVIGFDLVLMRVRPDEAFAVWRVVPTLAAVAVYLILARCDRASLGLTVIPIQGAIYWFKATAALGVIIGGWILAAGGIWILTGHDLPLRPLPPARVGTAFVWGCVQFPLLEESIYRLALCVPFAAFIRPVGAIALSGVLFGFLHVFYGNASADNLVAGYFLAWSFLKSGTIVVPVMLHSVGNACGLCVQVATWYWLNGGGV